MFQSADHMLKRSTSGCNLIRGPSHHNVKRWTERGHPRTWQKIELNASASHSARFTPGKESSLPIKQETGWAPEQVRMWWCTARLSHRPGTEFRSSIPLPVTLLIKVSRFVYVTHAMEHSGVCIYSTYSWWMLIYRHWKILIPITCECIDKHPFKKASLVAILSGAQRWVVICM